MSREALADDVTGPRKRAIEFDYMRIVAAAAVVFIHAAATAVARLESGDVWNPLFLLRAYATAAVPIFIFISGALVWTRPPARGSRAYFRFLGHRLRAVIPAYLVWTTVYWLITYSGYGWTSRGTGGRAGIVGFLWRVVTGTQWVHLYFVPLIVLIYAITPIAAKLIYRSPKAAFAVSVGLALAWIQVMPALSDLPGIEVVGRLFGYMPYAVCGAWYWLRRQERATPDVRDGLGWLGWLALGIVSQTLYATATVGPWPVSFEYVARLGWTVAIIVGLAGASVWVAGRFGFTVAPSQYLAPLTYWVFLMHPALLMVFYAMVRAAGLTRMWTDPQYVVLKWAFALIGSFVLAASYRHFTKAVRARRRVQTTYREAGEVGVER